MDSDNYIVSHAREERKGTEGTFWLGVSI
jgi:hypothetical protein